MGCQSALPHVSYGPFRMGLHKRLTVAPKCSHVGASKDLAGVPSVPVFCEHDEWFHGTIDAKAFTKLDAS